jgi:hypothetical protein
VYGLYTEVSNDSGGTNYIGQGTGVATVGWDGTASLVTPGGDAKGFSLGMTHSF